MKKVTDLKDEKEIEGMDALIQAYIECMDEEERKAERNYRLNNVSLEFLQESNVPVEALAVNPPCDDVLEQMLNEHDGYGLLEIVENEKVYRALKDIKEIDMQILTLRYQQQLLIREIAGTVCRDQGTIRRHIESSLTQIKRKVEDEKD